MSSDNSDISDPTPVGGYSTDVRIELRVNGTRIPVAQTGGGRLIFEKPVSLPAGPSELVIHIDGHERRWEVTLRPGNQPSRVVAVDLVPA